MSTMSSEPQRLSATAEEPATGALPPLADPERMLALAYAPEAVRRALHALWALDEQFGTVVEEPANHRGPFRGVGGLRAPVQVREADVLRVAAGRGAHVDAGRFPAEDGEPGGGELGGDRGSEVVREGRKRRGIVGG